MWFSVDTNIALASESCIIFTFYFTHRNNLFISSAMTVLIALSEPSYGVSFGIYGIHGVTSSLHFPDLQVRPASSCGI